MALPLRLYRVRPVFVGPPPRVPGKGRAGAAISNRGPAPNISEPLHDAAIPLNGKSDPASRNHVPAIDNGVPLNSNGVSANDNFLPVPGGAGRRIP